MAAGRKILLVLMDSTEQLMHISDTFTAQVGTRPFAAHPTCTVHQHLLVLQLIGYAVNILTELGKLPLIYHIINNISMTISCVALLKY